MIRNEYHNTRKCGSDRDDRLSGMSLPIPNKSREGSSPEEENQVGNEKNVDNVTGYLIDASSIPPLWTATVQNLHSES